MKFLLIFFYLTLPTLFAQIPGAVLKETIVNEKNSSSSNKDLEIEMDSSVAYLRYEELEKLKSPRETMSTFLVAMDEVKKGTGRAQLYFDQAARTFNLTQIEENFRQRVGRQAAERLINTLDRIAKIDLESIPNNPNGPKWYFRKQAISKNDSSIDAEIAIEKNADGAWRFSAETVQSLGHIYSTVSHLPVVSGVLEYSNWKTKIKASLPIWMSETVFFFSKAQWLGFLFIFILALIALSLSRFLATIYIHDLVKKESLMFKEKDHYKSTLPFGLLAFSLVCMAGIRVIEIDLTSYEFLVRVFYILIAISSVWSSLKIVDLISMHFAKIAKDTANKFDDVLIPILSKTSKVLVVSFGTILVAHSLTFDIGSILAGLGIGGVAVALAAKDTISNLFGSVTLIIDRPFLIGDYVLLDKGLEGTVEEVGFRSTRIRTPHQSVVTLPNNVLANMAIDNYGMRESRRFRVLLQIDYETPTEVLEDYCERLRYLCQIHQVIDPATAQVYIFDMTDKAINILVNVYFKTTIGTVELSERHKFILAILQTAKEVSINFSSPLQLQPLIVEKSPGA